MNNSAIIYRATCFTDRVKETQPGCRGNLQNPHYDRLWRVSDIIEAFCESSQAAFNPAKQLCIDEMVNTHFILYALLLYNVHSLKLIRKFKKLQNSFFLNCPSTPDMFSS